MRGAAGFGTVGADRSGFGIPGGAEENDDGRQVHPDEKTDDRGQTAVHDAVGHTLDVKSEKNIGEPPQERGDDGARDDVAKTGFLRTRDTVDHDQGRERKDKGRYGKKQGPQSVERRGLAEPIGDPMAQGTTEYAEDCSDQKRGYGCEKQQQRAQL